MQEGNDRNGKIFHWTHYVENEEEREWRFMEYRLIRFSILIFREHMSCKDAAFAASVRRVCVIFYYFYPATCGPKGHDSGFAAA